MVVVITAVLLVIPIIQEIQKKKKKNRNPIFKLKTYSYFSHHWLLFRQYPSVLVGDGRGENNGLILPSLIPFPHPFPSLPQPPLDSREMLLTSLSSKNTIASTQHIFIIHNRSSFGIFFLSFSSQIPTPVHLLSPIIHFIHSGSLTGNPNMSCPPRDATDTLPHPSQETQGCATVWGVFFLRPI